MSRDDLAGAHENDVGADAGCLVLLGPERMLLRPASRAPSSTPGAWRKRACTRPACHALGTTGRAAPGTLHARPFRRQRGAGARGDGEQQPDRSHQWPSFARLPTSIIASRGDRSSSATLPRCARRGRVVVSGNLPPEVARRAKVVANAAAIHRIGRHWPLTSVLAADGAPGRPHRQGTPDVASDPMGRSPARDR